MTEDEHNALKFLVGSRLSSIEFVQDYVQLRFNGPCLTALTPPHIRTLRKCCEPGAPEYRNVLCDQIGKLVHRAFTIEAQEIRIDFDNEVTITISLRPDDYQSAEAAIFDNPPQTTCVW